MKTQSRHLTNTTENICYRACSAASSVPAGPMLSTSPAPARGPRRGGEGMPRAPKLGFWVKSAHWLAGRGWRRRELGLLGVSGQKGTEGGAKASEHLEYTRDQTTGGWVRAPLRVYAG